MMGRKPMAALALAALLVTAGCAGVPGATNADAAGDSDGGARTITVDAGGEVQAQPDQAIIHLEVVTTGEDVQTVRQRLASNASSMREALLAAGLNESQITTERYDIRQDRIEKRETGETAYRATHAFAVTVSELDRVGELIDTAVANGANNVNGIQFTLSDDRREELRQEALAEAMDTARSRANVVAERANLTVTGVGSASTVETGYSPYSADAAMMTAEGGGGTSVSSGPVTVSARVTVTFNATA